MNAIDNPEVSAFAEKFTLFKLANQGLLAELEVVVQGHLDDLSDVLDECSDELKSSLGADAANAAGDDEDAQEQAIQTAETWVADTACYGGLAARIAAVLWVKGCEQGAALLRARIASLASLKVRLTLDVTFDLNGANAEVVVSNMRRMCENAISNGMLTTGTQAEVELHSLNTVVLSEPQSEDELADFMLERIENGDLNLEDIPVRLARYGLMEPNAFVEEMRERMEFAKADQ